MRAFAGLLLVPALLVSACGRDAAGPTVSASNARPALWRVQDTDTILYLFGTVHMLPAGVVWRSEAVDRALAESQAVYLETDVEGDPAAQVALVERLGRLAPPQRLGDLLTSDQRAALIAAAGRLRVSSAALETMRPWLAAVTLADMALRDAGYSPESGVETIVRKEAEESGKDVRFLETLERQMSSLAGLPEPVQLAYLDLVVAELPGASASLGRMVDTWLAGDADALARMLIDEDIARLPEMKEALLSRRNAEWVEVLDRLLDDEEGVIFVAVGTAHLVGDEGVPALLAARGHPAERVQ